jgi:hypothetical protein
MTGPEHYREGEELLILCGDIAEGTDARARIATEAQAHFLAALVATTAAHQHPESVAWAKVIEP